MARKSTKRGYVSSENGRLNIFLYWDHPETGPVDQYRWKIKTREKESPSNKAKLEERLTAINTLIDADAFAPCQEFPGHKIANYCRCPICSSVTPSANAYHAPRTLGELLIQFDVHELARATGEDRIIEKSSYDDKAKKMAALRKSFDYLKPQELAVYEYAPLTDYEIRELMPEAVKDWLIAFGNRQERLKEGKEPNSSKYLIGILSVIRQALEYGRLKTYWKDHPLLSYQGALIQASKEERSRKSNSLNFKPFSITQRDDILNWLEDYYLKKSKTYAKGKERLRCFFLYHYCVIAFNTGLRSPSEMTALEWSSIDYQNRSIYVCQSREASGRVEDQIIRPYTKTVNHRYVPINQMALDSFRALEQHRLEEDWVFWNPRAEQTNPFLNKNGWAPLTGNKRVAAHFNKAIDALGIESEDNTGQYRMRHTFVTLMLDHTSFSDAKVAALIGDNVETMKAHYAGHCVNRWRNDDDLLEMDAMNQQNKKQLTVIK